MLKRRNLRWVWLSLAVIVLDQITKQLIIKSLVPYVPKKVLPFFDLNLMFNRGAAFSFMSSTSGASWFFGIIAVVVSVFILIWLLRLPQGKAWLACGLSLVLGGALANLIDRVIYGTVIDYLYFHVGKWSWPAFNLADSAICIGAVMLLLDVFIQKKNPVTNTET
jgi:signal peptidase II